jgi:hypothetical protein
MLFYHREKACFFTTAKKHAYYRRRPMTPQCDCGSDKERAPLYDGYGIFLCYACDACRDRKIRGYRHDIFERYQIEEPIDE